MSTTLTSDRATLLRYAADALRQARKLPIGSERNDLRQREAVAKHDSPKPDITAVAGQPIAAERPPGNRP